MLPGDTTLLKPWYAAGGPEQGFRHWLADGLNQRFSFVCDER